MAWDVGCLPLSFPCPVLTTSEPLPCTDFQIGGLLPWLESQRPWVSISCTEDQVLSVPLFHQSLLLECDKNKRKTVAEAKVEFLKYMYRWPTFGSAFFEVKVSLNPCSLCPNSGPI